MKQCNKCGVKKPFDKFHYRNDSNTFRKDCKVCFNLSVKERRDQKGEAGKTERAEYNKEYRKANIDELLEDKKEYYKKNKKEIRKKQLEYRKKNRERFLERQKAYYDENKEDRRLYNKEYRKKNHASILKRNCEYAKKKRRKDPLFKLINILRSRIYSVIKNKANSSREIVGCSCEELKKYLSDKFKEKHSVDFDWNFYIENNQTKGWHVDHIIPLASAQTEEELYELCHYTNLQFLWWEENLDKSDKIII